MPQNIPVMQEKDDVLTEELVRLSSTLSEITEQVQLIQGKLYGTDDIAQSYPPLGGGIIGLATIVREQASWILNIVMEVKLRM